MFDVTGKGCRPQCDREGDCDVVDNMSRDCDDVRMVVDQRYQWRVCLEVK